MIRRPLHPRFAEPVLARIKTTTFRDAAWPVGVPIMLYHWTGRPYKSPQQSLAPIAVESVTPIRIEANRAGEIIVRDSDGALIPHPWIDEGFDSAEDFASWFRPLLKGGGVLLRQMMRFNLLDTEISQRDSIAMNGSVPAGAQLQA